MDVKVVLDGGKTVKMLNISEWRIRDGILTIHRDDTVIGAFMTWNCVVDDRCEWGELRPAVARD